MTLKNLEFGIEINIQDQVDIPHNEEVAGKDLAEFILLASRQRSNGWKSSGEI